MSSPATAAFLEAWRVTATRAPVTLMEIVFPSPSTDTIQLASSEVVLPDGSVWESGFRSGTLRETMGALDTGPNPMDVSCQIANRLYPFMASGVASDTFATHQWQGAAVTIWFWNDVRDATGAQVLDTSDRLKVFSGVVDGFDHDDETITLALLQPQSWNRRTPPKRVDKQSFPNATDAGLGLVQPVVMGDFSALPMRAPHATSYGNKRYQEDSGGGRGVVPLLLVDPGLAGGKATLLAAGHECADLLDRANGITAFIAGGDVLAPLDTAGLTETLAAGGSKLEINDNALIAYVGVPPVDVRTSKTPGTIVNTATNPRNAMDVFDETSYARLSQPGADRLVLMLPDAAVRGDIEAVDAIVCYTGAAANTHSFHLASLTTADVSTNVITMTSTVTSPTIATGTWVAGTDWSFAAADLYLTFSGGTTNTAKVHWVVLRVKYRPQRNLMTPGDLRTVVVTDRSKWLGKRVSGPQRIGEPRGNAPTREVVGSFFANLKGAKDDGSGTYTGTAGALIQSPPDMIRWYLDTFGEASTFETAAGAFGSFTDGRSLLRNGGPSDYRLAARVGEVTSVQQVLQRICEQSLSCVTLDPTTGKWLFHVWKPGAAVDYDWQFTREDVGDLFRPGVTSNTDRAQGVRVQWGYDYFLGRTMFESYVTEDSSSQGYSQATTRDQRLVIDSTNDRFDWKTGAWGGGPFTYADSLSHATYTDPMDLAADIQDAVLRIRITAYYTAAGYGHFVRAGFNDSLNFWYGTTPVYYNATIPPGDYRPDEYWAEIAALMNSTAGVSVFTASYSHATNKGTVVSSGQQFGFQSKFTSHTAPERSATWTLGFNLGTGSGAGATTVTSALAVYADRFWMASEPTATFQLLAQSGANIANGCWGALGYDAADTSLGNQHLARLARGLGESEVAAIETAYGPQDDETMTCEWIRDEITAQNFRDRLRAFRQRSRPNVRIRTFVAPDLQRMRVIGFHESVDERHPYGEYGSDGSWAAKAFRVLEIEKDLGPDYYTEFYAEKA